MMAAANGAQEAREVPSLPAGWPTKIMTRAWVAREDDYWFALDADFDIVAQGTTSEAAERELCELVVDYLNACMRDGVPFDRVRRPVPLKTRLRLDAEAILTRVLGHRSPKPVRVDHLRVPPLGASPC